MIEENKDQRSNEGRKAILSLMVAADENNVIGLNNKLPWHLPADMKYFKNQTWALPVIMGRKTFESLGKPLPGRNNIVITRNATWGFEKVQVAHTLEEGIALGAATGALEIFVIGGAELFKTAMPLAGRIYLTHIHHRFQGDAFFPTFSLADWELVKSHAHQPDPKNLYAYTFEIWERRS